MPFILRNENPLEASSHSRLTSEVGPAHDPYQIVDSESSAGFLVMVTGVGENMRMALPDDFYPPTAPLVIRAPSDTLSYPLFGWEGGAIFGDDFAWRYRFKNSQTGEVSGLSPLPEEFWNLGAELSELSEDWTGQDAWIELPGTDFPGIDILQIFRNTSSQVRTFYLLDELPNPGEGEVVEYHDNLSDEDLFLRETAGLNPNPGYFEGGVWACAKVHAHTTGRVMLYGLRRHANIGANGNTVEGERFFELSEGEVNPAYIGMRLSIPGTTVVYQIVNVSLTGYALDRPAETTFGGLVEITDARDGRTIFVSRPGKPWSYDLLEVMSVGHDQDDAVLHIDAISGQTVVFTRRHVYALMDDYTEAPHLTYRVITLAEEGTLGLRSTAYTPFGLVFANERGVRLLGALVTPLGSSSPFEDFLPRDQYAQTDISTAKESYLFYDPVEHLLHFSYTPYDSPSYTEELIFDPDVGIWRGPWRRRVFNFGDISESGGERLHMLGDDYGNLLLDQRQDADIVDGGAVTEARILKLRNFHTFDTDRNLGATSVNDPIGAPALIEISAGVFELVWIVNNEVNEPIYTVTVAAELPTLAVGQRVLVGYVEWSTKTAYFDAGEPVRPKEFSKFRVRYAREGDTAYQFKATVALDGLPFEKAEYSEVVDVLPDEVYADLRIEVRGRVFQIGLEGVANITVPRLTNMVTDISVRRGD